MKIYTIVLFSVSTLILIQSYPLKADDRAAKGALFGGLTGAALGGAISGRGSGALIGGLVGAGTGAAIGSASEPRYTEDEVIYYEDNSAEIQQLKNRKRKFVRQLRAEQRKVNPSARKIRMYQRRIQLINDQIADLRD